jgi:hypothetical protein
MLTQDEICPVCGLASIHHSWNELAACLSVRDEERAKFRKGKFHADKMRQRALLSHLDDMPGQTEMFAVDGEL